MCFWFASLGLRAVVVKFVPVFGEYGLFGYAFCLYHCDLLVVAFLCLIEIAKVSSYVPNWFLGSLDVYLVVSMRLRAHLVCHVVRLNLYLDSPD